jgi:zinc protease
LDSASGRDKPKSAARPSLRRFRLKNGSTLWVKERKHLPLGSIGAFFRGGFSRESPGRYGLTALMAKCLQKGTDRRNHEEFSREVESLAAHLDTALDKDFWSVTLDVLIPNFEKSFSLMLEALWEPSFSEEEVRKEKKLQLAAIQRLKDDPAEYALLESDMLTFAGTPYGHAPLGSVKTVGSLGAGDVRRWHRRHLSGPGMTWIAVGDFEAEALRDFLDSKLPRLPASARPGAVRTTPPITGSGRLDLNNDSRQANLVLGFRAPSFKSPEYFSFRVLNTLLNGMGGKLFVELREKKSLAYSVFAAHDAGAQGGIYQIYMGCAPAKVEEAERELLHLVESFARGGISASELERAKTYMIGLYQVGAQSNRSQVHSYARYELSGFGAEWMDRFPDQIRKVRLEEVRRVAGKYLGNPRRTWVRLGPMKRED